MKTLTKKQQEIITLIYRYRFLTRTHIQTFLNHKSPSLINQWLTNLMDKNYLTRIYSYTLGENTKPAIYYLAIKSIQYLKQNENLNPKQAQNLYYEHRRSLIFRNHCITLADFACNLLTHARKQEKKALFLTKNDYNTETDDLLSLLLQQVKPDAYYSYTGTGIAKEGFIIIIDEHIPSRIIETMIRKYLQSSQEDDLALFAQHRFPSLLFITPTEKKLRAVERIISRLKSQLTNEENKELRCNLTMVSDVQQKAIASNIWIPV